jgi:hypothetical protein
LSGIPMTWFWLTTGCRTGRGWTLC